MLKILELFGGMFQSPYGDFGTLTRNGNFSIFMVVLGFSPLTGISVL